MTLFRQIAIFVSLLFILLASTIMWSNFSQYNQHEQGQLQSTANDMATNLGITIANTVKGRDTAAIDTIFNSVFDSSYFSRIELISPQGEAISLRNRPIVIHKVPDWFIEAVPLTPATGSTMVMQGWQPLGTLKVTMHPGYAYATIYKTFQSMLVWLGLLLTGGLLLLWLLLNLLLKPLKVVQHQAESIEENRFHIQLELPKTKELHHVSAAMNRMVEKVERIFNDQARTLNLYHELLYKDAESGLGNRRYLMMQLDQTLRLETHTGGILILLNLHGLDALRKGGKFELAEQTLQFLGQQIDKQLKAGDTGFAARLNTSDFAVFLETSSDLADSFCRDLFETFAAFTNEQALPADQLWLFAGLAQLNDEMSASELLSRADFSLAQSKATKPFTIIHTKEDSDILPMGKAEWRQKLQKALDEERFFLVGQPAFSHVDTPLHLELLVRLRDDNTVLPAGRFMPIAADLGMDLTIDQEVQAMVLKLSSPGGLPIAINLSHNLFKDSEALAELEHFVSEYAACGKQPLHIEIRHITLLKYTKAVYRIADKLRQQGIVIGIDHFDPGSDLQSVRELRPSYLKINARQLIEMGTDASPTGIQPLHTLADSMDMRLIAIGIDQDAMIAKLKHFEMLGFQGNLFGEPGELS